MPSAAWNLPRATPPFLEHKSSRHSRKRESRGGRTFALIRGDLPIAYENPPRRSNRALVRPG